VSLSAGSQELFILGLTKTGTIYIWGDFIVPLPNEDGTFNAVQTSKDGVLSKLFSITPQQIHCNPFLITLI
jgi:alpha-tubulin suppressor-like RCC1 family protein